MAEGQGKTKPTRRKTWLRTLMRLSKTRKPATAIRQWASKPSRRIMALRRFRAAARFAKRQAAKYPQTSTFAKYWRGRRAAWTKAADRIEKEIEADLGKRRIIPREEWDPNPGDRATAPMSNDSEGLFVHHSVAGSPTTEEGEKAEMRNLEAIARSRGFADFSYSFGIAMSGRIYEGRGKGIEGAHTLGFNDVAHAAVAMGNFDGQEPSKAMLDSYKWLRKELLARQMRGHRDVNATGCPGNNLYDALFN